jgi:hypothetical protein
VDEAILAKEAEKAGARTMSNVQSTIDTSPVLGQALPIQEIYAAERGWNEQRSAERTAQFQENHRKALDAFEASFDDPDDGIARKEGESARRPVDDYLKQEAEREAARAAIRAQLDVDRAHGGAGLSRDERRPDETQVKSGVESDGPER